MTDPTKISILQEGAVITVAWDDLPRNIRACLRTYCIGARVHGETTGEKDGAGRNMVTFVPEHQEVFYVGSEARGQ